MRCTDKKLGRLLLLYEFDKLSDEDRQKFEFHVMECDFCFQNIHSLAPVVSLMKEEGELALQQFEKVEELGGGIGDVSRIVRKAEKIKRSGELK